MIIVISLIWTYLVLVSIQGNCRGMCEQEVMGGYIRLRRRIPSDAVLAEGMGAALRWQHTTVEASDRLDVGLVDGDPVLHPVPEVLEAGFGIRGVSEMVAQRLHSHESGAEQSIVFILKGLREV